MSNRISPKDIDLEHLEDLEDDEFFENKEKITRALKSPEESKDNNGHKKATKRIQKPH